MLGCIRIFCAGASSAVNSTRHRRESYAIHFPSGMPTTTRTRVVPDAEVRGAIALAFHVFLEAGSAYAVVHDPIRPAPDMHWCAPVRSVYEISLWETLH
jgi:hypothetical protein